MKSAIFLLVLCCASFALIDPPVQQVDQHDRSIAPQGILHQNFLNYSQKEPTLDDPTAFFYVKILTLTPSVNMSIASKLHPALIWMATEKHNATVREGYDNGDCDERMVTRHFEEMKLKEVTADYTLDGLRQKAGNETVYNTANATVVLATGPVSISLPNGSINVTDGTFTDPSDVPFKPGAWCAFISMINTPLSSLLGGMINLSCYEASLAYASPYGTGAYNLTERNLTIVNPHLNVTLRGTFTIDYSEHGTEEHMDGKECKSDSWDDNGTLTLTSSDFASYEVQNDYMTLLPYLPGVFSLSGNTSEDVMYHASLLSNSNLYKYYSEMDNRTAGAYYVYAFNVTQDGYGTQSITATEINHSGLLPQDNETLNNYTAGPHRILNVAWGKTLRSPTEMNSLSYNYSRIYDFEEVFYNVSGGEHHAKLEFYTWFGNYSAPSDINVSSLTAMTLHAYPAGNGITAVCTLTSRDAPVAGQTVELRTGNQTLFAVTNDRGVCTATFNAEGGATTIFADFRGTPTLLPSSADNTVFSLGLSGSTGGNFSISNFGILLVLGALFAFSFLGMTRSFNPFRGGAALGDTFNKFFPFARKPEAGRKMIRVKQGKELATSVAMAAATGGAGAAVAGKAAEEAAKKKLAEEAAKKEAAKKAAVEAEKKAREMRAKRELTEKGARKAKLGAGVKKGKDEKLDGWALSRKQSYTDLIKGCETRPELEKHRGVIKIILHDSHVEAIKEKISHSCEKVGLDPQGRFYKRDVTLHISRDAYLDATLIKDSPFNPAPEETYAITRRKSTGMDPPDMYKYTIYLRESRADNAVTLLGDGMHENYHPYHKMAWDDRHSHQADGFCEIMAYEDIVANSKIPKKIRGEYSIVTGPYREYAAQEYLLKEIIGHEQYVIGHLVEGEDYLRQQFEKVSGGVRYDEAFFGDISEGNKIKHLLDVHKAVHPEFHETVKTQVKRIIKEGKYDI